MKQKGIAVIIKNEAEYNKVRDFLTPDVLYIGWVPQMETRETAVVLKANKNSDYSSGIIGCAASMRADGIKTEPFIENLITYLL